MEERVVSSNTGGKAGRGWPDFQPDAFLMGFQGYSEYPILHNAQTLEANPWV